jgi:hypothetical protein
LGTQSVQHANKKKLKLRTIQLAAKLFHLSEGEKECLANKAGLSFLGDTDFTIHFQNLIKKSNKSYRKIYEEAQISERMFYRIIKDLIPTKTTLLALAIALDMNIYEIEKLLQGAGYALSHSIAFDMVVKWLIEHTTGTRKVMRINDVLQELEIPLLMVREKSPK